MKLFKSKHAESAIPFLVMLYLIFSFPLFGQPDLTLVGYLMPEDGLGKISINILETLGSDVSANIIHTRINSSLIEKSLATIVQTALKNPDNLPGKVAILTDAIQYPGMPFYSHMPQESLIKIAYSMFETDNLPQSWIDIINHHFDALVVPDPYLQEVYQKSGVKIPAFVVPIPMNLEPYFSVAPHRKYPFTPFINKSIKQAPVKKLLKALHDTFRTNPSSKKSYCLRYRRSNALLAPFIFGDASALKNPEVLVEAFSRAFGNNPHVELHLRAAHIDPNARMSLERIVDQYQLTNVKIEDGPLPLHPFIDQLASYDCYVNLSRGEGFSFIPREALALAIPVITTNNTSLSTVCQTGFVRAVASHQVGPPKEVYRLTFGSEYVGNQFDCSVEDAMMALLDVYENYENYLVKARKGREWVGQYDCKNAKLKQQYMALIKPAKVVLGDKNEIIDGTLITQSQSLYLKYQQINSR